MSRSAARVLLSGYYGFGNFGDEAILRVFVDQWRQRRPDDAIAVLSATPEATAKAYGVAGVARMTPSAVIDAIHSADLVVSGGGGLLQSSTSLRSLLYYTGIIREAHRAGRAVAIFAQGIGPLDFIGKQVVKRTCGDADLAIVRDEASAALLRPLVPRVPVDVAADPVFLAASEVSPVAAAALDREGVSNLSGDLVAVVVRRSPLLARVANELAAAVDRFSSEYGANVVFVPFQRPDDAEAAIDVIRRCKSAPTLLDGGYDLDVMTALFSRCAAVVAMRLHALILAARLSVPFLAIPYDPKVAALTLALSYPLQSLDRGIAGAPLVDALWSQAPAISRDLTSTVAGLEIRAADGFDRLAALAEGAASRTLKRPQ
jgi:polysaccharide pyruvyl transferase CsaB